MVGRMLCRVGVHRWQKRYAKGVAGNAAYLSCVRCDTERDTPGPERTRGMTGIGG